MKTKKILALMLAAFTLLSVLAGCAGGEADITASLNTEAGTPVTSEAPQTDAETTVEETTAEETTAAETTAAETTAEEKMTAEQQFRYDNFANGKLSDALLDSVNPGVLALLSECMYFEAKLQEGIAKGQKWVYSNKSDYVPQSGTFDNMIKSGKYGANCAMPQAWAFIDLGVVTTGKHIYGTSSGDMANFSTLGKYIGAVCTLTSWEGTVQFNKLYAQGKVEPGDIFLAKGHTFIYMGDKKFMAAGHDGHWHKDESANTEDTRKAVFDSWVYDMMPCANYTYAVYWQIRFKDEYVPRYYRNAEGKLVANPAYDASKNIEYKAGKSPETPEVIYAVKNTRVYDESGRTNVLQGITASTNSGFNLSKISSPENMTDGQLLYDNTVKTYSDCQILGGGSYALNPTYYCDANGNTSPTKDATHKYLAGIKFQLKEKTTVDSFSLYTQAVGASSNTPFGDIDGFDILVSEDGVNWTLAYSAENMTSQDKWSYPEKYPDNKASTGYYMCHYIDAKFDKAYEANYVLFAMTSPRTSIKGKAQGADYSIAGSSSHYFRISEFQVYKKQ